MSEFSGGAAGPGEFRRLPGEEPLPAELRMEPAPKAAITAPDDRDDTDVHRDGVPAEEPDDGVSDADDDQPPDSDSD